jgi:hypothetical protein
MAILEDEVRSLLTQLAQNLRIAPAGPLTVEPGEALRPTVPPPPPLSLAGLAPLPVSLSVRWAVVDQAGRPAIQGEVFAAPDGLEVSDPSLVFNTQVVEGVQGASATTRFSVRATVELSVYVPLLGPVSTGPVTLPDLPVSVPPLPIPTILALGRHKNFEPSGPLNTAGFILLVTPTGSTLGGNGDFDRLVQTVQRLIPSLDPFFTIPLALTQLLDLNQLMVANPLHGFRVANRIDDLADVRMVEKDVHARNRVSALMLIHVGGRLRAQLFGKTGLRGGRFSVSTRRRPVTSVSNLRKLRDNGDRQKAGADPVDAVDVEDPPAVAPTGFGDTIASLRFLAA